MMIFFLPHNSIMPHWGPFIPKCAPMCVVLNVDGRRVVLNDEQSHVFVEFVTSPTHDETFNRNFWMSLHPDIHRVPEVYHILQQHKSQSDTNTVDCRKYRWAKINGRPVELINYKTEHPHIFRGRGDHPLRGSCKFSVCKKDVIINRVNEPAMQIPGYTKYVLKPNVSWTACWKDPLTKRWKYILMADSKRVMHKFDQARLLHSRLSSVRKRNKENCSPLFDTKANQSALATHLIERLGIRIGNEKDADVEALTIGCCSLEKHTHVQLRSRNRIRLTFLGKDSIPFDSTLKLSDEYFNVVEKAFKSTRSNLLFDKISPPSLNNYLNKLFPNLTAKVFRTCIASSVFQKELHASGDLIKANKLVAQACNHRRMHNGTYVLNLNTSRSNYIDPRIYFAYIRKHPEKRRKDWFQEHRSWAQSVSSDYRF